MSDASDIQVLRRQLLITQGELYRTRIHQQIALLPRALLGSANQPMQNRSGAAATGPEVAVGGIPLSNIAEVALLLFGEARMTTWLRRGEQVVAMCRIALVVISLVRPAK